MGKQGRQLPFKASWDSQFVLSTNGRLPCCVTGWAGSSLQSLHGVFIDGAACERVIVLVCGVWLSCARGWVTRPAQYSAAYSVPWSPRHSNVNSFTISFIRRLLTRSLREGAIGEEDKHERILQKMTTTSVGTKQKKHRLTWESDWKSLPSVRLWSETTGSREAAAPPSATPPGAWSSSCWGWTAPPRNAPSGSGRLRPQCPAWRKQGEMWRRAGPTIKGGALEKK